MARGVESESESGWCVCVCALWCGEGESGWVGVCDDG